MIYLRAQMFNQILFCDPMFVIVHILNSAAWVYCTRAELREMLAQNYDIHQEMMDCVIVWKAMTEKK